MAARLAYHQGCQPPFSIRRVEHLTGGAAAEAPPMEPGPFKTPAGVEIEISLVAWPWIEMQTLDWRLRPQVISRHIASAWLNCAEAVPTIV